MSTTQSDGSSRTDWIRIACWAGIAAYFISVAVRLARGEALGTVVNLGDLSFSTLAAGACVIVLILRSPNVLKSATMIEANEARTVGLSFFFIFVVMAAYYILRPVRDAMASDWSNTEISVLWNIQLVVSAIAVAFYGLVCSRITFKSIVPSVYAFFAVTFVAFYFGAASVADRVLLDKSFYVWVSLFSMFHVSVFWSFMADLFTKEQSRRVFAFIAAGMSAGATAGPLFASQVVTSIGTDNLMLLASVALIAPMPIIFYLQRLKVVDLHNEEVQADLSAAKIGGNPLAGFKTFFTSPYLIAIGVFILLYTTISSFVYFEQTNLLRDFSREERTAILSGLAAVVNILTFGLGMFATSRIVTKLGMPVTLALVPVFICAGLLVLAFAPILTVLLALQVARQGANYGITRPAREMLFTNVDRETRFKSKPVIDVVVYRGGDAASSIAFASLTDGLGLGLGAMAAIGAGVAAVWAGAGIYCGRVFNRSKGGEGAERPARAELARAVSP